MRVKLYGYRGVQDFFFGKICSIKSEKVGFEVLLSQPFETKDSKGT